MLRLALALLTLAGVAAAQVPSDARPAGGLQVGDVIELRRDVLLEFPARDLRIEVPKERGPVEIRGVDVSFDGAALDEVGERWARVRIEAQLFAVGEVEIPALPYTVLDGGGVALRSAALKPEMVEVMRSLADEEDPVPAGLAPPVEMQVRRERMALLVVGAVAVLVALALIGRGALRRWMRMRAARPGPPPPPPEEVALAQLDRLLGGGALRDGDCRRFHIELATILKRYLEDRFAFPALERTTGELGRELRPLPVDGQAQRLAVELLVGCDGVKFAGERPDLKTMRARVRQARTVVERTTRDTSDAPEAPTSDGELP